MDEGRSLIVRGGSNLFGDLIKPSKWPEGKNHINIDRSWQIETEVRWFVAKVSELYSDRIGYAIVITPFYYCYPSKFTSQIRINLVMVFGLNY